MLIFEATSDDVGFLNEIQDAFPENVIVAKGKNFSGSTELIDVIIVLTPTILSTISILMNNMLKHRVSKMELEKNQPSEVTFKYKNDKDEYEIVLKSSTISNKDELEEAVVSAMNKIKELQGYE